MAVLILKAASAIPGSPITKHVIIYCDNYGAVSHGNNYKHRFPESQTQADILRLLQRTLSSLSFVVEFRHFHGHQDDNNSFDSLWLPYQMYVIADQIAQEAFLPVLQREDMVQPYIPLR